MAMEWRDDDQEKEMMDASTISWDLEDALARAILGDVDDSYVPTSLAASTASMRDAAEEERLIERLHARLFPTKPTPRISQTAHVNARTGLSKKQLAPRVVKPSAVRQTPMTSSPQSQRSISPEKIDQMVIRFRLHEAKRSRKLASLQQQSSASSIGSSASVELVNPRSRELTRSLPGFQERQAIAHATRERDRERHHQRDEQQQRAVRELRAQAVRTPCICGAGHSSVVSSDAHAPACVQFMDACEKTNTSSEIKRKRQHMRRTVDDLIRYHDATKRKQLDLAATQQRIADQETTFTPQLNKNSVKIYEGMVESGRVARDRLTRATTPPISPRPRQPPLCAKSKLVLKTTQRRSSITSQRSIGSRGLIWTGRRRPSHRLLAKAASFSESHWITPAAVARKDTPPSSPPPPPLVVPWTDVAYEPSSWDFILASFEQPAWFQ